MYGEPEPPPGAHDPAEPCPFCGRATLAYQSDGWISGAPLVCLNPVCDSNHP